jgi:3-methyl-2-oxobutanoate hydroxymethyltransferase
MGHIGLQPQSVVKEGGYKIKGKDDAQIAKLIADAKAVEEAGAFAIVIEGTIAEAAAQITKAVSIPTIAIGGSPECDGQILVTEDLLGLLHGHRPKFVTEYAHLRQEIDASIARFAADVRAKKFPAMENLYTIKKTGI